MTAASPPVLRVAGPLRDALAARALDGLAIDALAPFLAGRRWFGAKGHAPTAARVRDVAALPWEGVHAALATIEVELGGGKSAWYQLPLAVSRDEGRGAGGEGGRAIIASVEASDGRGVLFDASDDEIFRIRLAEAVVSGEQYEARDARWIAEPVGDASAAMTAVTSSRVGSAEQSNTSIIYGDHAILKLFRKLERGENPDVEIGRFLTTHTTFRNTPTLLGTLRVEDERGSAVAGMMQRFVPGSTDAWSHALASARPYFAAKGEPAGAPSFAEDARELGRVTRALHEALAIEGHDPAFDPVPATEEDLERWAAGARRSMEEALELLEARLDANALPAERVTEATALVEREGAFDDLIEDLADEVGEHAGLRVRHHGDYHLGQVLRSADGDFLVIDFEGEPARPLAERREKHSALRDVAGMMRSFAYAAATVAEEHRGRVDPRTLETRAARWERAARDAFLAGYLEQEDGRRDLLPRTREGIAALIALFETEKAFYELSYELNNRPAWVWIPLRGVSRLLYK